MEILRYLNKNGYPVGWSKSVFQPAFEDITEVCIHIQEDIDAGVIIAPMPKYTFQVFYEIIPEHVNVVFIGESPYPNIHTACGIAFSQPGCKPTNSLANMLQELSRGDSSIPEPTQGDLLPWVHQGVLLLNKNYTVDIKNTAKYECVWNGFNELVFKAINSRKAKVIYVLMGRKAQSMKSLIGDSGIFIQCPHPSPLNGRAFEGSNIFNKVNAQLVKLNKPPIRWNIY